MTPRFVRLCLVALFSGLALEAGAQPASPPPLPTNPPSTAPAAPPVPITNSNPGAVSLPAASTPAAATPANNPDDPIISALNMPDADIDTILSALELYTKRTVLRPAQLPTSPGGYNLNIKSPIPMSQAVLAIETVLALNNIGVSPLGDRFLVVTPLQMTRTSAPEMITGSAFDQPASGKIAVKVFQLQFMRVQEFLGVLQPLTNPSLGTQPIALVGANAIMVTDSVSNLQRIETLLQELDKPTADGMKPKFYTLVNGAKASDIVQKLQGILRGTLQTQLGTVTNFSADDRTNQVILVTDPRQYPIFDDLIARLDVKAEPNTRQDVIYLNHAKAVDVVNVLSNIISKQTAALQRNSQSVRPGQIMQPNQPNVPGAPPNTLPQPTPNLVSASGAANGQDAGSTEFSSIITVVSDERSNSVVVSGTVDDIRLLKELIAKLDIVLAQVRIEVVIAEVTLDDSHTSGISQLGLQLDGDRLVGISGAVPGLTLAGTSTANASISRLGGPGSLTRSLDLVGLISLSTSPRKNNTTVLSVPSITTTHATAATFFSGETRPIVTNTVSSGVATTTGSLSTSNQVVQEDIGITLTVTPLIGSDGSVYLDITQDVKDVAGFVTVNGDQQPIISHRSSKSFVSARSGDIKVLGGMQRNKDSRQTNRLGPIPFIGDLFGSRSKDITRTELVFFVRPLVLTNTDIDNTEVLKRIGNLPANEVPQKDEIMKFGDPNFVPPPKSSVIDKILPK